MFQLPSLQICRKRYTTCAALVFGALLAACGGAPVSRAPAGLPPLPALPDAPVYAVDAAASEVRVLVYRDGPLAAFGHNHLLIAPVSGKVHAGEESAGSGFHFEIKAGDFDVDPPGERAVEGEAFADRISHEDRRGTRRNLLGPAVLDASRYPVILVQSVALRGPRNRPQVLARVTLRGTVRDIAFPADVAEQDGVLTVDAGFTLVQSDFNIEPFSILGGGLSVRDALDVRVHLVARKR